MIISTIVTSKDGVRFSIVLNYPTTAACHAAEALERAFAGRCTAVELKPLEECGDYHRVPDQDVITCEFDGCVCQVKPQLRVIQGGRRD